MASDEDDVTRVLKTVFTSKDWRTAKFSQYLRYATIAGKKWGVVISSKDPPQYQNLILNKIDVGHLIKTKKSGKIDAAYVVFAKREGGVFVYLGHREVEELYPQLEDMRVIFSGKTGMEYWILPSNITGDDDGDPF
jgi:hypothetical protein